jgi:hypothetical protein
MKKIQYEAPRIAVVGLRYDLMDGFPVHWSQENSGDIEARPSIIFEEEESDNPNPDLWKDDEEEL